MPVALLDAAGRTLQATELRQSERREFFLLRGLDPRDRDYEQHRATSMTRADLARWARTPPALRLSSVAVALTEGAPALDPRLAALAQDTAAAPAAPNGAEVLDSWSAEATMSGEWDLGLEEVFVAKDDQDSLVSPEPAPIAIGLQGAGQLGFEIADLVPGLASRRPTDLAPAAMLEHASVVMIRAGKRVGNGFYVRKDLVLTTYALVDTTSVVDVTTAEGAMVPALVAAVDQARNLALLHVPRPGPAVVLYEGPVDAPKTPAGDLGPGYPLFSNDQVIGMTTGAADQDQGVIAIDAIRGFLDGQAGVIAVVQ